MINKLILTLLLFLVAQNSFSQEKVKLYLKWKHQYQFAGFYVAKEKGFYKDEGLDVELIERDADTKPIEKVQEEANSFGLSDSTIVYHFLKGEPITIVSTIFQHSPMVLLAKESSGIQSPLELKGKRVMYQRKVDEGVIRAMFTNVGLTDKDYIPVDHTFRIDEFLEGKVDATSAYVTNQPYYLKKLGVRYNIIQPSNYGVDQYGDLIFTSWETALENPSLVKKFRRASVKGWMYAMEHMGESIKITQKYSIKPVTALRFEARHTKKLILPDVVDIGTTGIERLERIRDLYLKSGKFPKQEPFENVLFDKLIENKTLAAKLKPYILSVLGILSLILFMFFIFSYYLKSLVDKRTNQVKELYKDRELFLSSLTHELRTPLNGILGSLEVIRDKNTPESEKKDLQDIIQYSASYLLNIVNDLLYAAKTGQNEIVIEPQTYGLEKSLKKITSYYQYQALQKNLTFNKKFLFNPSLAITADEQKLNQVLHNILSNAFKYTQKGQVDFQVSTQIKDSSHLDLKFKISDTGVGISNEDAEKIFLPFYQTQEGLEQSHLISTGLGLSVAFKIAHKMNGKIYYEENPMGGSSFYFDLFGVPYRLQNSAQTKEDYADQYQCLLIDDVDINLKVLSANLKRLGCAVDVCHSGKEALEKVKGNSYDLIFLDYNMPGWNGEKTLQKLKEHFSPNGKDPQYIGCTANSEIENNTWPVDYFIEKPINKSKLGDLFRKIEKKKDRAA